MRETLFRGKRTDNNKWIEGGYCYCNNKSYIVITTRYIPDTRDWDEADYYEKHPVYKPMFIEVIPETVGQFTGLYDRNDKKIFEGDVVKTVTFGFDCEKFITEVKFGARSGVQGFYLANGRSMFYFGQKDISVMDDTEVIGNIYDNPELLKGD